MKHHNLSKNLSSPFVFTCEHASPLIPKKFKNLGLTEKEMKNSKDLFDPGAIELAQSLAKDFNSSFIHTKFSRLVIDANRILNAKSNKNNTYHSAALKTQLLIEDTKGERLISIPNNIVVNTEQEEKTRWDIYVKPYFEEIEKLSAELLTKFDKIYIFQIHSFYPKYNDDVRKVDIGMIHNNITLVKKQILSMQKNTDLYIGDNEPWGMPAVGGGILKPLQKKKEIVIVGIDINNKHLTTPKKISNIQKILSDAFRETIKL